MKNFLTAIAVGSLCIMPAMGATYQTKGAGTMQTADIYNVTVGPGTVETRTVVSYTTSGTSYSATVNYLTVDLTNKYVTPKVGFADKHKIQDVTKTVPQMMSALTSYSNHYFAGVNGDFFGYITNGVTVADGTYVYAGNWLTSSTLKNPPADSFYEGTHFVIDKDGLPYIADHIEFGGGLGIRNGYAGDQNLLGEVTFPDGSKLDELRVNGGRYNDYLVLYSPYPDQTSTGTNIWGTEAELTPSGNRTIFGAEGTFKVGARSSSGSGGDMAIPDNGFVLSGVGARAFADKVPAGSKVRISIPFKADGVANSCRETLGGWPRLVTDGTPLSSVPSQTPSDLQGGSRRARTAVGFSKDRKTLYIVVVEENSSSTGGMTFKVLGNFMEAIGCYHAMALDGGGSSVLHVENLGQRSKVQGGTYNRPVMDGLFLVTNAPESREITSIEIVDKSLTIKPGKGYVPTIYGYNKYGVLVCTNVTEYTLSAPAGTATFNSGNRKMIAPQSGSFTLTAKCGKATYSIPVTVSSSGIDGVTASTTASFSAQKTTPVPTKPADWVDPVEDAIYIAGNFNGWDPLVPMVVEPTSDKIYEFEAEHTAEIQFKFTTLDPRENGGWEAFKAGDNGVGVSWHISDILAPGKTVPLVGGNGDNIATPWAGKYHFVINLEQKTITATTSTPRPALTAPGHLYLMGNIEGHQWQTDYTGAELTGENGIFTIDNVVLTDADANDGIDASYFRFVTATGDSWDAVNASTGYGAWKSDASASASEYIFEGTNSWKLKPGEYNFTVNFKTGKVKIEEIIAPIYAQLENITPDGYDWEKMEVGPFAARQIPTDLGGTWWTAPAGTYSQELMDRDGHVISIHQRGGNAQVNNDELFANLQEGLSIQDMGGYIGKVLVFNQQYGPGANVYSWPYTTKSPATQISFYLDASKYNQGSVSQAIRIRLVFQVLHRGRHVQDDIQVPTIYACAANSSTAWPISHNGVGDDVTGKLFPIDAKDFYRWENEGDCIAEIPEEKVLLDGTGTPEPWDENHDTNPYLINSERFMVYEWDVHSDHTGTIGVHFNIAGADNRFNTYIFKEVKFYNIVNGEEIATQPRAAAPRKAKSKEFTTTTAYGSLAGTRHISYRYYTENGVAEIEADNEPDDSENTGVEDIIDDTDEAPAEYYNLQGIRVSNPSRGVYIVRQGDKVRKVLVRE
ncbi:MAG: phosphodiester glycosidase family protein [Muribaculaceae bacterium]|nr:phosphodiester glycosidase family protein [Muribaculaceae bacterium]